jgi:SMODS-associating 2TM, beta-strand rich effector domain
MKNIKIKNSIYCIVGLSILTFYILILVQKIPCLTFLETLKLIPTVVSIDLVFVALFIKIIWKWRIFRTWLVTFPNMNGTWKGSIHSTWIDPSVQRTPSDIPAILTIRQTFPRISCVMRTAEMTSRSIAADFIIDEDNQLKRLTYIYDCAPMATKRDRSAQHLGTMIFDITEKPEMKISGEYWTGRKTTGIIDMTFWKKERMESFPNDLITKI